ncbi:glycosyltransferase family 4 protein [Flavobacterium suncheonense]|uniref:glycosyltransferase family 4 protein n=1 Tax=Flavobacterium suncheonense TaxID=350894 RepID=UPI003FA37AF2
MMRKILFIHQSAELYGSDKTLLLLLQKLDRSRFHPVVILPFDGPLKRELELVNIEVVIAPVLKLYRDMFTPKNLVRFVRDIRKGLKTVSALHRKHQFDFIYSNTLAVLLGMLSALKVKKRHLWHVHEIIEHPKIFAAAFPILLNRFSDVIICNSHATKENLTKRNPKLSKKAMVIHNGLEPDNKDSSFIGKEDYGFENEDVVVTLVGRISRLKGHKWVLKTITEHFSKHKNLKFLFVGSPVLNQEYYLEEVEQIIADNQLNDMVKILPFTLDLTPIWSITDIALMPSTEPESFGMVALEAMLAQKPVIGSDHGGLREIIENKGTGYLIAPNDVSELSAVLRKLIAYPELRIQMGQKGYERARQNFSVTKYIKDFEKLFQQI